MDEREYLEHLEAIGRYITSVDKVQVRHSRSTILHLRFFEASSNFLTTIAYLILQDFKEKVSESRKRPNAYFGYAVGIALDVDPDTADAFFKDLPYE